MDRLRRSMLYIPGNNPGMVKDVHIYKPDSIMFDLEDSVALSEKDSARFLIFSALKSINYGDVEKIVRVNGLDTKFGRADLEAMVRAKPDIIRLPKTETPNDIIEMEKIIEEIEIKIGMEVGTIKMMAAVETAKGILNAREIATSSKRLIGIAIGAEDFVTDLKTTRSPGGIELLFARSTIVLAARAAGISAIDTVYSDVNNEEGFLDEVRLIKQLGFDGKSLINPRQIEPLHNIFNPTLKEYKYALDVLDAIEEAKAKGSGVISLRGKMIDKPMVDRAHHIINLAKTANMDYDEESVAK